MFSSRAWAISIALLGFASNNYSAQQTSESNLPIGVRAVWDLNKAWHETTSTRERICLNGLWRWQPTRSEDASVPTDRWGWFKVPGCWPGIGDYMQKDCQNVYAHPSWKSTDFGSTTSAWYQREFTIPDNWRNRQVWISAEYVNSLANLYIDGMSIGHISFPGGKVDIGNSLRPKSKHILTLQVFALPLKGVLLSYSDTNAAKAMKANVNRRGLCGDVFLESKPPKERIDEVKVETSVQHWTLKVHAGLIGIEPLTNYKLLARVSDHGKVVSSFSSPTFTAAEMRDGIFTFSRTWQPEKLWDINTPQNQYKLELTLASASGTVLDVQVPKQFGFRELWIRGRDFILNGSRVFWSCVPIDNAAVSADLASYRGAKETMLRLKSFGINMVYTHNYDCNPGSFLAFDEILQAADDVGMLVALTQPHFSDYDWSTPQADSRNGYARQAAFFVHVAANHPSVIAYSTSHNATGYNEDMNPDMIDGLDYARNQWALNNVKKALRAEAIIHTLDSSRLVYHHSSGSLGSMHTVNFYLNWVPIQELDDWFEHWATEGIKPAFMVEFGVPFSWDWSMYRGYYKGQRNFGSAQVPWEYCMAEWNAQFLGDHAYNISDSEKRNLRWEAPKFGANQVWFRWDYPQPMGSTHPDFEDQQKVWAKYTTDNWRAFRTWGVSGISPWETYGTFWRLKPNVNRKRVELTTDWDSLQRPGYSADYIDQRFERRDTAFDATDWEPTTGGKALLRNNRPLLAYIGGRAGDFTEKGHNFRAGSTIEKQLIVINNSREPIHAVCNWTSTFEPRQMKLTGLNVPTGGITQYPVKFIVPSSCPPGAHKIKATFKFSNGDTQEDEFAITVLPVPPKVGLTVRMGIFDPLGDTTKLLGKLGVYGAKVGPKASLSPYDVLIIGKNAMTPNSPGIDLHRVRSGQRVIVFEQTGDVLEQRFGFRIQEYGLRNVFPRIPDHPILSGLNTESLRDWRGAATVLPPRLKYKLSDAYFGAPTIVRNGIELPHVWRCGSLGNVSSVMIEKPARGDFRSILDGGFSLQYSPLLEYREGKGQVIFCQMDVSGRTESDPAAEILTANLVNYVFKWSPQVGVGSKTAMSIEAPNPRSVVYAGDPAGKLHLELSGFDVEDFKGNVRQDQILVLGPNCANQLAGHEQEMLLRLRNGLPTLAIGLDQGEIQKSLQMGFSTVDHEYINAVFESQRLNSKLSGIGPADVYNRAPRSLPILSPGDGILPGGVLGNPKGSGVVFFQLTPWTFDQAHPNTRRVFRHASAALTRLLCNFGVQSSTPLLDRFATPIKSGSSENRWLRGLYLDKPELEDDPYRFFGW